MLPFLNCINLKNVVETINLLLLFFCFSPHEIQYYCNDVIIMLMHMNRSNHFVIIVVGAAFFLLLNCAASKYMITFETKTITNNNCNTNAVDSFFTAMPFSLIFVSRIADFGNRITNVNAALICYWRKSSICSFPMTI